MFRRWLLSVLGLFFAAQLVVAASAEDDWKMPRILPFPSKHAKPPRPYAPPKTRTPSMIRPVSALVPDLLVFPPRDPNEPSTLAKLTEGTKKLHRQTSQTISRGAKKVSDDTKAFFIKTKEILDPWPDSSTTSSRRRSGNRGSSSSAAGGGLLALPKWWSSDDQHERAQPITMSDWLGQPRPGDD